MTTQALRVTKAGSSGSGAMKVPDTAEKMEATPVGMRIRRTSASAAKAQGKGCEMPKVRPQTKKYVIIEGSSIFEVQTTHPRWQQV